jgi:hypothetical protein
MSIEHQTKPRRTPAVAPLRSYAVKDGDRGIAEMIPHCLVSFQPEHEPAGWVPWCAYDAFHAAWRQFRTEFDQLNLGWATDAVAGHRIYRDLLLTELWVPAPEPVEISVGMKAFQWNGSQVMDSHGNDRRLREPDADDIAAADVRVIELFEPRSEEWEGKPRIGFTANQYQLDAGLAHDYWGGLMGWRCAVTGRPLKLPAVQPLPAEPKPEGGHRDL